MWIQITEEDVGIGDGRLLVAAAVTRGPRCSARTARSDLQRAGTIEPDETATAGTYFGDVDDRQLEGVAAALHETAGQRNTAADFVFIGPDDPAVFNHRCLGRSAAHVERDHVGAARRR